MDISRRGLLSGAGVFGSAAVLGAAGLADAAPTSASAVAAPGTTPPGIDSISSPPQAGVSYRFASWIDTSPLNDFLSGRRFATPGVYTSAANDSLGATFDLPPGAIAHDVEIYLSAQVNASIGVAVWSTGVPSLGNAIAGPLPIMAFADSAVHAKRIAIPSHTNGPFPHGTKLVVFVSTATSGKVGLNGIRLGLRNAPLSTVLITPARVYDSRTHHAPLRAGKTRTISLASHLPHGANGAIYTLSVVDTHSHGALKAGAGGSSLSATALQWSRTGDRVSVPVTSAVSSTRTIGVRSATGSGATDFTVDLTGYLV